MNKFTALVFGGFLALALSACGGGSAPQLLNLEGTWTSPKGGSRYVLRQNGTQLTGEAFFRDNGQMIKVGNLTGSTQPGGQTVWKTALTENGSEGSETVSGTFSQLSFSGSFVIHNTDGTVRQQGSQKLNRDLAPLSVRESSGDQKILQSESGR